MRVARRAKGARRPLPEARHHLSQSGAAWCARTEAQAMRVARSVTFTRQLHGKPRGALGRRGREADPDSRSEAEGLGRAEGPMSGPGEGGVIWWSTAK